MSFDAAGKAEAALIDLSCVILPESPVICPERFDVFWES